jgi:hypothetical protein
VCRFGGGSCAREPETSSGAKADFKTEKERSARGRQLVSNVEVRQAKSLLAPPLTAGVQTIVDSSMAANLPAG